MRRKLFYLFFMIAFMFLLSVKANALTVTESSESRMTFKGSEVFNCLRGITSTEYNSDAVLLQGIDNLEKSELIESGYILFYKRVQITLNGEEKASLELYNGFYFSDYKLSRITAELSSTERYDESSCFYDVAIYNGVYTVEKNDVIDYFNDYKDTKDFYDIYLESTSSYTTTTANLVGSISQSQVLSYFSRFAYRMLYYSIKEGVIEDTTTTDITIDTTTDTTTDLTTSQTEVTDISLKVNLIEAYYYNQLTTDEIIELLGIGEYNIDSIDISLYEESYNKLGTYQATVLINDIECEFEIKVIDNKAPDIICSHIKMDEPYILLSIDEIKEYIEVYDEYDGIISNYSIEDLDNYKSNYNIRGDYRYYITAIDNSGNISHATFYIYVGSQSVKNVIYIENSTIIICNPKGVTEESIINILKEYNIIPSSSDVTVTTDSDSYVVEVSKGDNTNKYSVLVKEDTIEEEIESNTNNINIGLIITVSIASLSLVGIIVILSIKIYKKRH